MVYPEYALLFYPNTLGTARMLDDTLFQVHWSPFHFTGDRRVVEHA
jgi:hypothetical protein